MHDARDSSIVRIVLQLVICLWFFLYRSVLALSSGVVDIPLIVRSPYLSAWQPVNGTSKSPIGWPTRPTPSSVLGWAGYARVDGKAYRLFGDFPIATPNTEIADISGIIITPTRTILTIPAGPITFNITFFSPIEPGDWVRQSIPFSYLYLDAISTDGESHSVQVYTDISAEWCSGNRDSPVNWTTLVDSDVRFGVFLTDPDVFNETQGQAEWGTTYYAMRFPDSNVTVTWESNSDVKNRDGFCANGTLTNSKDNPYGPIRDDFPVFAIAVDLQDITRTVDPVVWAIGLTREPAIAFIDLEGKQQNRSLYYKANYSSDDDLMNFFLGDFSGALFRADELDAKIISAANSVSSEYSDILSLGLRQCLGATELTLGQNSDGTLNSTDVMMFMEDMGGVAHSRVNAVETLFEMFPMIMYIDPSLGRPILEPLFKFQNNSAYTHPFSSSDIGLSYPNADATTASSILKESANMIIMSYAYARTTGDGNQANSYYILLKTWADYLVNSTLYPSNQFSIDGIPITANQTNLALKGIIAIKAMSELSSALEVPEDRELYANKAADLYSQWKALAVDSPTSSLLATYGQSSSWTLGDNIFFDLWLQTGLVEESVRISLRHFHCGYNSRKPSYLVLFHFKILDAQTQLYSTLIGSGSFQYGLPADSSSLDRIASGMSGHSCYLIQKNRHNSINFLGWNLRAAAISANQTIAQSLISTIRSHSLSPSIGVGLFFPTVYNITSGESFGASR
ncbi:uncharacterized protein STEHIDRAFT_52330 [Stereum hirsutum FP-91666 SS1]|uniref:uncharacterized protein n=1 Tax=Stereum hirsutum (strain FP-91666) TaxID=721885 RepID=UPI000440DB81|nr:uncharacterized protein STEHIDRAFT_52330 [Stereum hirsutum FP-91666 SS1]EIM89463.1 hypothetical protein STEHIDRAFT_52330 [Stereum hirsutum FP-91666 SS1]